MTQEDLYQIFKEVDSRWEGDNAFQGLQILSKYINPATDDLIQGADHDVIFGPNVEKLLTAGLTEEDAKKLAELNWLYDDEQESLNCFV